MSRMEIPWQSQRMGCGLYRTRRGRGCDTLRGNLPRVAVLGAGTELEELTGAGFRGQLLPTAKSTSLRKTKSTHVSKKLWAHSRLFVSLIVGIVVGVFVPLDGIMLRILAAWNAAGWLYIALLGVMMFQCEVAGIRKQASLEDESRSAILVLTILASAATMVAVGAQLSGLSKVTGFEGALLFTLSFSTILVSWFLVHFVFALYYAHEFHSETRRSGGSGRGFDFHGQKSPDYLDFLYLSLVIGTTAQTSDIDITSRETRRTVMLHGLLSFFFNTTVIALVVNLTAQFAG